jgi:chromosome segregation ATPase
VQRAERAVEEAEGKLALLKKWSHEIETRAEPLVKQIDQFQGFLTVELPKAVAQLRLLVKALDAYTDLGAPGAGGAAPAGGDPPAAEKGAA